MPFNRYQKKTPFVRNYLRTSLRPFVHGVQVSCKFEASSVQDSCKFGALFWELRLTANGCSIIIFVSSS